MFIVNKDLGAKDSLICWLAKKIVCNLQLLNFLKVGLGTVHAIPICCCDRSALVICTNSLEMHKTALYVSTITA